VGVIEVTDMAGQGRAMLAEIQRLRTLGVGRWDDLAVLTRHRRDLAVVRGLAEREGVPVQWPLDHHRLPPLYRMREIWRALQAVKAAPAAPVAASAWFNVTGLSVGEETNPWRSILVDVMRVWEEQSGDEPLPPVEFLDFVLESLAQRRRDERMGHGVVLSTVHGAKGAEYRHVLLGGGWGVRTSKEEEEERRVFYVGMTRARESLTIFRRTDVRSPLMNGLDGPCFTHRRFGGVDRAVEGLARDYALLGLDDIFLDYLGRRPADDPGAAALRGLTNGDILTAAAVDDRLVLKASGGAIVGVLSESGSRTWLPRMHEIMSIRLLGAYTRQRSDVADPAYAARLRADEWEVPLCELALSAESRAYTGKALTPAGRGWHRRRKEMEYLGVGRLSVTTECVDVF
jgi:ATP-dependent DNA helicase RecQ